MKAEVRNTQQLTAMYSRLAIVYDAWTTMLERKSLDAALERAGIHDGESVLEVAVGSGYVFQQLLRRNPSGRNVGTDLTNAMLDKARRKAVRTGVAFELEQGDARSLCFADDSFDVVLSNNMLGLLSSEDAEQAVREMVRVLRPGGRLVLVRMIPPQRALPKWIYWLGAMRLGGWSEVVLEPIVRACGIGSVERDIVTQLGFPSEMVIGHKGEVVRPF